MGVRRLFHTTIATEAQDNSLLSTEQTLTLLRKPTEAAPQPKEDALGQARLLSHSMIAYFHWLSTKSHNTTT